MHRTLKRWHRQLTHDKFYLYPTGRMLKIVERYRVADTMFMLCEFDNEFVVLTFSMSHPDSVPADKFTDRLSCAKSMFWESVANAEIGVG